MSLGQVLLQSGAIGSIANELGIDEQTAKLGAAALMPAITAGIGRSGVDSGASGGMASLLGGLGGPAAGALFDLVLGAEKTPVDKGNNILADIFGSKDVSRSVATEAAGASGVSPDVLKKMLPLLAMAAMGYLAKRGAAQAAPEPAQPSLGGVLGSIVDAFAKS